MKHVGLAALLLWAVASEVSAQPPGPAAKVPARGALPASAAATAHQTFTKYCVDCHGANQPKAGLSITRVIEQMSEAAVGEQADAWLGMARMLETSQMPPDDADRFPSDAERAAAAAWIRASLDAYEAAHGGDPGRVTVRRLTSAEYAYAIRDLTGVDVKVGIDASSDSVGGEGFANFGDVQFVQDATVERYLEAAKQVADHAVIGSGPLALLHGSGEDGPRAVGPQPHPGALRVAGIPGGLGRGRTAVRLRSLRQGVLRRLALPAPRRARRRGRDASRARRPGGHHRTLRRAHLGRGQPGRHGLTRAG